MYLHPDPVETLAPPSLFLLCVRLLHHTRNGMQYKNGAIFSSHCSHDPALELEPAGKCSGSIIPVLVWFGTSGVVF